MTVWATAQSQIKASLRVAVAPNVLTRNKIFAIPKTCHQQRKLTMRPSKRTKPIARKLYEVEIVSKLSKSKTTFC